MGQKTHPIGFRLGVNKAWNSRWFARGSAFSDFLFEDMQIRRYVNSRLSNASVARIGIQRDPKKVTVDIHTSRPGIVIGRKGAEVDKLREELHLLTKKDITLNIVEVKRPELSAKLVADSIASQLSGRVAYRRAMKRALAATMKMGAQGIKIICGGRLAGAEIARTEKYREGRVPLHTLRSDIDYAISVSRTTYGAIGVKVWICKGEIMDRGDFSDKDEKSDSQISPELAAMADRKGRRRGDEGRRRSSRVRGRVRRGPKRGPGGPGDGPRDSSKDSSRDASAGGEKPSGDPGKREK